MYNVNRDQVPPSVDHLFFGSGEARSGLAVGHRRHRQTKKVVHRFNERLEDLVAERTVAMEHERNEAKAASHAKSAFLETVSHELRSPLNAILLYAQLMSEDLGRSPMDFDVLGKIIHSGEHLKCIINNVLSISEIEARKLTVTSRPFDFRRCMDGLQGMIQIRAETKGLNFQLEVDPALPVMVEGDEVKLRQVLLNLLTNAVKFTSTGHIGLRVRLLDSGLVRFEVFDTGAGTASSELERLFGRFSQTESGLNSTEGCGLGLYLSQSFVQLMGGEIQVESVLGCGSTFRFVLPLLAVMEPCAPEMPASGSVLIEGQSSLKQLVVDDQADNLEVLSHLLRCAGFTVQTATTGEAALAIWKTWAPDVVWMDMRMTGMDGYETTRNIRRLEAERGLPQTRIPAYTACAFEHEKAEMMEAGCDAVLTKPFRVQEVFDLLARHANVLFMEKEH